MNGFDLEPGEIGTFFVLKEEYQQNAKSFDEFYATVEPAVKKSLEMLYDKGILSRIAFYCRNSAKVKLM